MVKGSCSLCTSRYGKFLTRDPHLVSFEDKMRNEDRGFYALCKKCEIAVKSFLEDLVGKTFFNIDLKKWIDSKFQYGNTAYTIINWCIENDHWIPESYTEKQLKVFLIEN